MKYIDKHIHSLIPFIQVFHVQLNHCLINSEKETNIYTAMSAALTAFSCTIYTQARKKSMYCTDLTWKVTSHPKLSECVDGQTYYQTKEPVL